MRHTMRLASFVMGLWCGCILLIGVAVPVAFHSVDSVLDTPAFEARNMIDRLGPDDARMLLRYQIAESNRSLFIFWGWMQVGFGVALLLFLLFGTATGRISLSLAAMMLAIATWMNWKLIPRMDIMSRGLDFKGPAERAGAAGQFVFLHRTFSALEGVIIVLCGILLVRFLRIRTVRRSLSGSA
jgi:hypothetical protein